jgi:serine O-acetyltransferase
VLSAQIRLALEFPARLGEEPAPDAATLDARARKDARRLLAELPRLRERVFEDARAAWRGDPSCRHPIEALYAFPGIFAVTRHRIANILYHLEVPLLPRLIAENAHHRTGIDIHPGASIGREFFIDHGTGVVIGETAIVGNRVTLYQGVTLGAKSFPVDAEGRLVKGLARHPIIEDDVTIYASATVLGRVTVGRGSVIGGNVWLTHSVPPNSRVSQAEPVQSGFEHGAGI